MASPVVLDLVFLQCAFLAVWAWFGLLLFGNSQEGNKYFCDYPTAALSLFTLFTTANFPDVMMLAYRKNRYFFLYFCIYVVLSLYVLFNTLLAALFSAYKHRAESNFQEAQANNEDTLCVAFRILASRNPEGPDDYMTWQTLEDFCKNSNYGHRWEKIHQANKDFFDCQVEAGGSRCVTLEMWLAIAAELTHEDDIEEHETEELSQGVKWIIEVLHTLVDVAVVASLVVTMAQTEAFISKERPIFEEELHVQGVHFACCTLYMLEAAVRSILLDRRRCFTYRGIVDMVMGITMTMLELLFYCIGPGEPLWKNFKKQESHLSRCLALLRIARIERVIWRFEGKRATMQMLLKLMATFRAAGASLFFVFYLYSTMGVQMFGGRIRTSNTGLEESDFGTAGTVGYWANNFNDFASGVVVLFELMVVNNWYVIAGGLAAVAPGGSHVGWIFCISFYFCIHIVILNVLVTSVVESYERIRTKAQEDTQRSLAGHFRSHAMEAASVPSTLMPPAVLADKMPPQRLSMDSTATGATVISPMHPGSVISDPGCKNGTNSQTVSPVLANLSSHLTFFSGAVDSMSIEAEANSRLGELDETSLLLDIPTRKASRKSLRKLRTVSTLSGAILSERPDLVRAESTMTIGGTSDTAGDGFSLPMQRRQTSSVSSEIREEPCVGERPQQPAFAGDWAPICEAPGIVDPL